MAFLIAGLCAGCMAKVPTYEEGLGPKELPKEWPTANGRPLRPVPMPSGEFLLALPKETTAQVLCQATPEERWKRLMGGDVAREVENGESCHAVGLDSWVRITLNRTGVADSIGLGTRKEVSIAGHPATVVVGSSPSLVEVKLADARVLRLETSWTRVPPRQDQSEGLLLGLTESVLDGAFAPGPKLPAADKRDVIERKAVEPGAGIVDAPLPEISWKLCTQLERAMGLPAGAAEPYSDGKCTTSSVRVENTAVRSELRGDPVAGRPASESSGELSVLLTDNGSGQGLKFSWSGGTKAVLRELAEKVVRPLLGS
ncbi:hypothetical protein B0293_01855 [Amycolatopsis azurea DSM 43854]|uniref:Uncharacterized protein n=1 Tax=Amycolatopsis azurea DSM 43854 TaxID=1238180 RepID=M2Q555_9PSEU|nr:hypothetical protein C791_2628 [Amycolatopsis azurea DSM 43854]OOC08672.1 hypothetical protein B0293_01855 [Amycolatopsis azurea DSM 43854]